MTQLWQANDQLRRAALWVVWSPVRVLLVFITIVVICVVLAVWTNGDDLTSPTPSATSTLPAGWQSWPSVTVSPS